MNTKQAKKKNIYIYICLPSTLFPNPLVLVVVVEVGQSCVYYGFQLSKPISYFGHEIVSNCFKLSTLVDFTCSFLHCSSIINLEYMHSEGRYEAWHHGVISQQRIHSTGVGKNWTLIQLLSLT